MTICDKLINDTELLRKSKILNILILTSNPAHTSKILFINNITRGMPTSVQTQTSTMSNILEELLRILLISLEVINILILYVLIHEVSSTSVAFLKARSVRVTSNDRRKIDRGDRSTELRDTSRNINVSHN